jgi:hypothetical protein
MSIENIAQFPGEDMNSEETQQDSTSPVTVQPASGFIPFADNDIEQSIPERFEI